MIPFISESQANLFLLNNPNMTTAGEFLFARMSFFVFLTFNSKSVYHVTLDYGCDSILSAYEREVCFGEEYVARYFNIEADDCSGMIWTRSAAWVMSSSITPRLRVIRAMLSTPYLRWHCHSFTHLIGQFVSSAEKHICCKVNLSRQSGSLGELIMKSFCCHSRILD